MLYDKNVLGRKYIRLITGSPGLFLSFVLSGVVLFLFLTLTTEVDVLETYMAETMQLESEMALLINAANISAGPAYIYSNRNEGVYPVVIERTKLTKDGTILYLHKNEQIIICSLWNQSIFIDIPRGKETLLYRVFMRGGKSRE